MCIRKSKPFFSFCTFCTNNRYAANTVDLELVTARAEAEILASHNLCLASVSIYIKNWATVYGRATQRKHLK